MAKMIGRWMAVSVLLGLGTAQVLAQNNNLGNLKFKPRATPTASENGNPGPQNKPLLMKNFKTIQPLTDVRKSAMFKATMRRIMAVPAMKEAAFGNGIPANMPVLQKGTSPSGGNYNFSNPVTLYPQNFVANYDDYVVSFDHFDSVQTFYPAADTSVQAFDEAHNNATISVSCQKADPNTMYMYDFFIGLGSNQKNRTPSFKVIINGGKPFGLNLSGDGHLLVPVLTTENSNEIGRAHV